MGRGADRDRRDGARLGIGIHDGVDHCIACLRSDAGRFPSWSAEQTCQPARGYGGHGTLPSFYAAD